MPQGDPFGAPQTMLLCLLGQKTVEHILGSIETQVDSATSQDDINNVVRFLQRTVEFLILCCQSYSTKFTEVLKEAPLGVKLTQFLDRLDPHLKHKALHLSLTKLFYTLMNSNMKSLSSLYPDCRFLLILYKKYRSKHNLINGQHLSFFKILKIRQDSEKSRFVQSNIDLIRQLREDDESVDEMVSNIMKDGEVIPEFNMPSVSFKDSEDDEALFPSESNKRSKADSIDENSIENIFDFIGEDSNEQKVPERDEDFCFSRHNIEEGSPSKPRLVQEDPDDDEEEEAKENLKSLLASMQRKKRLSQDEEDGGFGFFGAMNEHDNEDQNNDKGISIEMDFPIGKRHDSDLDSGFSDQVYDSVSKYFKLE